MESHYFVRVSDAGLPLFPGAAVAVSPVKAVSIVPGRFRSFVRNGQSVSNRNCEGAGSVRKIGVLPFTGRNGPISMPFAENRSDALYPHSYGETVQLRSTEESAGMYGRPGNVYGGTEDTGAFSPPAKNSRINTILSRHCFSIYPMKRRSITILFE